MKTLLHTIKATVLFVACTTIFYYGILWVTSEVSDLNKYEEPESGALKVSTVPTSNEAPSIIERMVLFFMEGE